ncbi:MAG TPA: LamG domain-containing protein [Gammaproteobacteria bacterium]|nr:LamG domain-containing protein [Gammaproteobacteria bacterium]
MMRALATTSFAAHWHRFTAPALAIFMTLLLAGCGGGATTEVLPDMGGTQAVTYTGPAPATADVQAFKLNVWDNLSAGNRCGACHGASGPASPAFVREDDVNQAYALANPLVDLSSPADSRLVTKVAGGHNCWLASDSACGAVITAYIEAWASGTAAGGGRQIQLVAPVDKDPGASKNFPADSSQFSTTVYPLLTANCAGCHDDASATPQAPFFAAADVDAAYEAAKAKIDLDNPANSRLVVRLRNEFHNCWSADCQNDADAMEAAITSFSDPIALTQIDPQLIVSKALKLTDGVIASGGSRVENDVIALYEFKTGQGSIAYDTSGVAPDLHLTLSGNVSWVGGWGIEFLDGKAQGSTTASKKLSDLIKATGEYSIEAWVVPANVTQEGPARIVSYSAGTQARNFTLGQTQYNYDFLHRSSTTDANGEAALSTADADEDLQATQQHVVVTFDPVNGRRIYVNGVFTDDVDPVPGGTLGDWDDSYAFVLGNEVSGDRQWQGKLRLVAIHNRALTPEQILQNFEVGVGEKFFLLFNVTDLVNVPESYIMFEVSQFDNYSYLFNKPVFISLDPNAQPDGIPVKGMRIGINGKEALVGQAYRNLDTTISSASYTSAGQVLSTLGTTIALEKGTDADEFFLTFEVLGNNTNVVTEPAPLAPPPPPDADPVSDIGVRTFSEINATMAAVTGVSPVESNVKAVYDTIVQQLPPVENIEGFVSANQMAVAQLAIEYCNALVNDTALRDAYFPGFNFNADANSVSSGDWDNLIITPLLDNMLGTNVATQPDAAAVTAEINQLITSTADDKPIGAPDGIPDGLAKCGGACPAGHANTVVKAACAAVLGSAALLLQ